MGRVRALARIAVIATTLSLTACGDLTRSDVERILNGEGRGFACQTQLDFNKGGFERAKSAAAFTVLQGGLLGATLKVADAPGGDQWQISCLMGMCASISRKNNSRLCLPGHVEVLSIADAPFAPNSASYKTVDYVEVVTLPPELKRMEPYVYTRYQKSAIFQKTDRGWRVMR